MKESHLSCIPVNRHKVRPGFFSTKNCAIIRIECVTFFLPVVRRSRKNDVNELIQRARIFALGYFQQSRSRIFRISVQYLDEKDSPMKNLYVNASARNDSRIQLTVTKWFPSIERSSTSTAALNGGRVTLYTPREFSKTDKVKSWPE